MEPSEYPLHTRYGDGEEIEDEVIDHIRSVTWKNAMALTLKAGDLVILENMLCHHSKVGYQGGDRKILVYLAEPMTR